MCTSVATPKLSLFVLARDPELFKAKYDAEVSQWLKDNGFTNPINKPIVSFSFFQSSRPANSLHVCKNASPLA